MSPKLLHQSFPGSNRLELLFDNGNCPLYVSAALDAFWLDTQLLPESTELYQTISRLHNNMLAEEIMPFRHTLDSWYSFSPFTRFRLFTLRVSVRISPDHGVILTVFTGNNTAQLSVASLQLAQASTVNKARIRVSLWECESIAQVTAQTHSAYGE